MISTIGKKPVNLQGPPDLVNFGLETAENGLRDFAHTPTFPHWETPDVIQQTAGKLTDDRQVR